MDTDLIYLELFLNVKMLTIFFTFQLKNSQNIHTVFLKNKKSEAKFEPDL
jgi:hypothetical protein